VAGCQHVQGLQLPLQPQPRGAHQVVLNAQGCATRRFL
jgi:hypothetical protein